MPRQSVFNVHSMNYRDIDGALQRHDLQAEGSPLSTAAAGSLAFTSAAASGAAGTGTVGQVTTPSYKKLYTT